ncbi:aryl-sulfate sulfotransferase [Nocardioides sp.]|uniref:aryl-sulfate sulfotransferase n=1 Tax=Nocardioides sp. TaxID=35761 RepID=UPI0037839545
MRRPLTVLVVSVALVTAAGLATGPAPALATAGAHHRDEAPVRDITVTAEGVTMYPAFDPGTTRYGLTTTEATGGTVTVDASTTDPAGTVLVDGAPAPDGSRTVSGLESGDEVSVIVTDAAGTTAYSLVYLPAGFPELQRDTSLPDEDPSPGAVLLTLALWTQPSPAFETAVDANGVPLMVEQSAAALDLKPIGDGHYTVFRPTTAEGMTGFDLVELDSAFQEVSRRHTVGLTNTDAHDAVEMPDGSVYLAAYERDPTTGYTDAVVQQVRADGTLAWEWDSGDHLDPAAETMLVDDPATPAKEDADYAHLNSMQVLPDGDLLLSFRHLSSVYEVARTAHDGFAAGDVVWRLGGRHSDFAFTDAEGQPDSGPCAQHTAYQLANGHILIFDNSAWNPGRLCVDPADPEGPAVARLPTRIDEWAIDPVAGTAHQVWHYQDPTRYAIFAGSAQRLASGSTVVGWASATQAVASEVDADGDLVWDLKVANGPKYFTYRAVKADVPDAQAPEVTVAEPTDQASYVEGALPTPDVACTDRGGSTLQTCEAPELDGTPGRHTWTATATDGTGNTTTVTRHYTVQPLHQPDAQLRVGRSGWAGVDRWSTDGRQHVRADLARTGSSVRARVRIVNAGAEADRFVVTRPRSVPGFGVTIQLPVARRTPVLEPGQSWDFTVTVTRRASARPGSRAQVPVAVRSVADATRQDLVVVRVRALR